MKGYAACFRLPKRIYDYFYTEDDIGKIIEIEFVKENENSFSISYGSGRNRRYNKKSAYYEFYDNYQDTAKRLAEYYEELADYKTTESENFILQARELREKAKTIRIEANKKLNKWSKFNEMEKIS